MKINIEYLKVDDQIWKYKNSKAYEMEIDIPNHSFVVKSYSGHGVGLEVEDSFTQLLKVKCSDSTIYEDMVKTIYHLKE